MKRSIGWLVLFAAISLGIVPGPEAAEPQDARQTPDAPQAAFLVIVHPANPAETLSPAELSVIFLKEQQRWIDGTIVEPVDLYPTSATRDRFSQSIHGRSAANIQSYWQQQIFSGRGVPPVEVRTDPEVVAFVREHRGGIGYVSGSAALDGVKILRVRTEPRRIEYVVPAYPSAARSARMKGKVRLEIVVDETGNVTEVKVIKGLGFGLSQAAESAVKRWRFVPATENGLPVASTLEVTVEF